MSLLIIILNLNNKQINNIINRIYLFFFGIINKIYYFSISNLQ
jgi:hypothetical protein